LKLLKKNKQATNYMVRFLKHINQKWIANGNENQRALKYV
jgi:hypothetical protein